MGTHSAQCTAWSILTKPTGKWLSHHTGKRKAETQYMALCTPTPKERLWLPLGAGQGASRSVGDLKLHSFGGKILFGDSQSSEQRLQHVVSG